MLSRLPEYSRTGVHPPPPLFTRRERLPTLFDVADRSAREDLYIARIGPLLQSLRKDTTNPATGRFFTQAQAAEAVGMDSETLGRWERKKHPPKVWELAPLAALYGVPRGLWYLLLDPPELPARSVRQHLLAVEAARLAEDAAGDVEEQRLPTADGERAGGR